MDGTVIQPDSCTGVQVQNQESGQATTLDPTKVIQLGDDKGKYIRVDLSLHHSGSKAGR